MPEQGNGALRHARIVYGEAIALWHKTLTLRGKVEEQLKLAEYAVSLASRACLDTGRELERLEAEQELDRAARARADQQRTEVS